MKTKTLLPFSDGKSQIVSRGDKIQLIDGETFTFESIKRTKWVGIDSLGKRYNVPIYRNIGLSDPFAKQIVGKNDTMTIKNELSSLNKGDLFSIQNCKQTFMFKEILSTGKISAMDIATETFWKIDNKCVFKKINLSKIQEKL